MCKRMSQVAAVCALLLLVAFAGAASAGTVRKTLPGGHTLHHKKRKTPPVTVPSRLAKLKTTGQITATAYTQYLAQWNGALKEEKQLRSWRSAQLADVTELLHDMAVKGLVTAQRLPALFATLAANATYWKTGAQLVYPDRVQFPGSELVWEYYPGSGLQLQVLGTFGEANGFYEAGKQDYPQLVQVLSEMEALAVHRGKALTWEYYFPWQGGAPAWVSAMAQGTALEAFANAYKATKSSAYLTEAAQLLPLFTTAPPLGVGEQTSLGWRYLQYSFEPHTYIINAFLQTLIGLDSYARLSPAPASSTLPGVATAAQLFSTGNIEAEHELPGYIVPGWSLYQPGEFDPLNYHELVTGFIKQLCTFTKAPVYCSTYTTFTSDLTTPPAVTQLTTAAKSGSVFKLAFSLSKVSTVGAIVTAANGKTELYTSAQFPNGRSSFTVPKLKPGSYTVTLTATDLAGNRTQVKGTLTACKTGKCQAP